MNMAKVFNFLVSLKINEINKTRKFHLLGCLSTKNDKRIKGQCRCGKV